MLMLIRFEDLRQVKDQLPHGSMAKIAQELNLDVDTVRNYFGSQHYENANYVEAHYEQGGGGVVELEDTQIYQQALKHLNEVKKNESVE